MLKFSDTTEQNTLHRAYYFCKGDQLTQTNMKLGTLDDAKKNCTQIYTPKICHNETEASVLQELIIRAEILNPGKCFILLLLKVNFTGNNGTKCTTV